MQVLELGLNFIPTPGKPRDISQMVNDVQRFTRNLRLHLHFKDKRTTPTTAPTSSTTPPTACLQRDLKHLTRDFKLPSTWTPPAAKLPLNYRLLITSVLKTPYITQSIHNKRNLTIHQAKLLKNLATNNNIIISPADKGGATVILTKNDYLTEGQRQLNDKSFYSKIDKPLTADNYDRIKLVLTKMLRFKQINAHMFNYLLRPTYTVKCRSFYMLPKIHKPIDKWLNNKIPPGRPIVSDVNSESYFTAQLITTLLAPFPATLPAFVINSKAFKDRVAYYQLLNTDYDDCLGEPNNRFLLVTADIDSLYTNMNIDRCLHITNDYLLQHYSPALVNNVMDLFRINLLYSDFMFDNEYYLQTCGVAMGKSFAPHLANLYLADLDRNAMHEFHIKPLLYTRYIDDIFFVWPGSTQQLLDFQLFLNSLIPGIRLTFSSSLNFIPFLDTTVFIDDLTILTKMYFKPTDRRTLLSNNSFHPPHTFPGIIKSQLIRYSNLCCRFTDYMDAANSLISSLNNTNARRLRCTARHLWLHHLQPTPTATDITDNRHRLYLPLTYNNTNLRLAKEIRDYVTTTLPDTKVITAWRTNRNLRSILRP